MRTQFVSRAPQPVDYWSYKVCPFDHIAQVRFRGPRSRRTGAVTRTRPTCTTQFHPIDAKGNSDSEIDLGTHIKDLDTLSEDHLSFTQARRWELPKGAFSRPRCRHCRPQYYEGGQRKTTVRYVCDDLADPKSLAQVPVAMCVIAAASTHASARIRVLVAMDAFRRDNPKAKKKKRAPAENARAPHIFAVKVRSPPPTMLAVHRLSAPRAPRAGTGNARV
jgi:hypothetical protein